MAEIPSPLREQLVTALAEIMLSDLAEHPALEVDERGLEGAATR
jgi:hypothetical protein